MAGVFGLGRALATLTRPVAAAVGAGSVVRPLSTGCPALHFNSRAIARAKEQAALRGRPDPFEGKPRVWYASIRNNDTSTWKLNLVARVVRGLPLDNAITQMQFSPKKASKFVLRALHAARGKANVDGVEDLSKLWVLESYVGRGHCSKGIRFHGRSRSGRMVHPRTHLYVKLQEGAPPKKIKKRVTRIQAEASRQEAFLRKPPTVRHSLETEW